MRADVAQRYQNGWGTIASKLAAFLAKNAQETVLKKERN
jgi:hypothetical protein